MIGEPAQASEAIVVIDLVESTATSNLFGWHVGRGLMRDLRTLTSEVAKPRGLRCLKSTGDGYLLTFGDDASAKKAAVNAVAACFALLAKLSDRNNHVPEERAIHVRFAVHFGEVDVIDGDREGPNVPYTFRIEGIREESLSDPSRSRGGSSFSIAPEEFPLRNYVFCSEQVKSILEGRSDQWETRLIGLFRLKGFSSLHEIFRVQPRASQGIG
jgi:class 3 adenylate cyclase